MTDRPIIFSAPMVRALLDGRKTQTRRVLKPNPATLPNGFAGVRLPYAPGDRLYVRENWQGLSFGDYQPTKSRICDVRFAATDTLGDADKDVRGYPWRPSIHMPRWASRLTLIVTDVRVQRLQDISEADAVAEGGDPVQARMYPELGTCRHWFQDIWNSIHGPEAWDASPWVVAVSFTVHHCNIDKMEARNDH